jgi:hypothetical protein
MKILFISSFILFEQTRFGGSKRLFYFAEALKKVADVDLICIDGCKEIDSFSIQPSGYANFKVMNRSERRDVLSRILYSDLDLKANRYDILSEITGFLKDKVYDFVLCAFPLSLSLLPYVSDKNTNITYLEDDLYFEKLNNIIANSFILSPKWIIKKLKLIQLLHYYNNAFKRVGKFICISEQERLIVQNVFPEMKVFIIKYGINREEYPLLPRSNSNTIGFIGNYNHLPNSDALNYFFSTLFNRLDNKYNVIIAGYKIPEDILIKYSNCQSVTFMENVENLIDFYNQIDIFINPIVSGRGLRTKLIEAASFGKPIISTNLGAEGLEDLRILRFTDDHEFIENVTLLFTNKEIYKNIIDDNVKIIDEQYEIKPLTNKLIDILRE